MKVQEVLGCTSCHQIIYSEGVDDTSELLIAFIKGEIQCGVCGSTRFLRVIEGGGQGASQSDETEEDE